MCFCTALCDLFCNDDTEAYTVEHDFNGHEVNGIHGVYGKKCYCRAFHLVNKLHDFNGMHDLSGNFCYDDFFRKSHARLYFFLPKNVRNGIFKDYTFP